MERRTSLRWGTAFGIYLIWYGVGRVWLEELRIDPTAFVLFGVKVNMATSMAAVLLGLILIAVQTWRPPAGADRLPPRANGSRGRGRL